MDTSAVVPDRVSLLFAAVEALRAGDPREEASRATMLAALEAGTTAFDDPQRHFTASAVVVSPAGVLLHLHKRLGLWLQPGGHIDPGEWPPDGALREVLEETGLRGLHPNGGPTLVHVDVHDAGSHTHLDLRYLVHAEGAPSPGAGESRQVRWFAWDEAQSIADPGLVGALRAVRARLHGSAT